MRGRWVESGGMVGSLEGLVDVGIVRELCVDGEVRYGSMGDWGEMVGKSLLAKILESCKFASARKNLSHRWKQYAERPSAGHPDFGVRTAREQVRWLFINLQTREICRLFL
jgi:hypothetical protein